MADAATAVNVPTAAPKQALLGYLVPILSLITAAAPALAHLASGSSDIKTFATNVGLAEWLPYISRGIVVAGICAALNFIYRRALAMGHRWALWLQGMMPWNRVPS